MLRKHFAMSGDNKPDFIITYHAPEHVPFFGGYAKNWVYGYPMYESGTVIDENPIKFKVIGDKWVDGVGEWKVKLGDSSNRTYNSYIIGKKTSNLDELPPNTGFGGADLYIKTDETNNIISEECVDNMNIITSVIFGEGIETINGSILMSIGIDGQRSCTEITLPKSVTQLTGDLFNNNTSLKSITVPQNVIRIDNLCNINHDSLEEVILKPLTPPDASNTSGQNPLGSYSSYVENSSKIRVYADCIDTYKNDSIWGQYSDLYDTINNTIVYYDGGRKLYIENQDITSINSGILPQTITNVYLPNSVTSIGEYAFNGCSGLTSITIPNSVTSIGGQAFDGCAGLTSIEIPNSVTSIGWSAFSGCSGLTSITIPNSVTSIGSNAFNNCSGLTSVVWNAVNCLDFSSYLNSNPFYTIRTQITSFEFGNSVEHIPAYMCYDMSNLTSITIPNSVTSIDRDAFSYCTGLTSITIPNSVTSIDSDAFSYCTGLTSITIPNSVTSIGDFAFASCSGLTSIIVDENNPIYDSRDNCNAIIKTETNTLISGCRNTIIPDSVTSIGEGVFQGCSGLTSITIPNSVTSIGQFAFQICTGLISIEIPNSVTSIGDSAFRYCSGLTSVTFNSMTPPTLGSSVFSGTHSSLQIYVPDESVDTYKNATNWSTYADKIKPLSQKPA